MSLPDVNDVYPQFEDKPVQKCDNDSCDTELFLGDEVIEGAGYHYCCKDCVVDQSLKEGSLLKLVLGEWING